MQSSQSIFRKTNALFLVFSLIFPIGLTIKHLSAGCLECPISLPVVFHLFVYQSF